MTKIKICGLSRPEDIEMVNEAFPDYIGFVFAPSRRQVSEIEAKELKKLLHPQIQAVGVFVNDDADRIIRLCRNRIIDIVQLHGDEEENYVRHIKNEITNPIIRAVRVRSTEDIIESERLSSDFLLLDAFKENQYGGSGEVFDWTVINKTEKPFFLAGGINSANVISAIETSKPYCIDVSSGVETDGFKDRNKIIDIVEKVRSVR